MVLVIFWRFFAGRVIELLPGSQMSSQQGCLWCLLWRAKEPRKSWILSALLCGMTTSVVPRRSGYKRSVGHLSQDPLMCSSCFCGSEWVATQRGWDSHPFNTFGEALLDTGPRWELPVDRPTGSWNIPLHRCFSWYPEQSNLFSLDFHLHFWSFRKLNRWWIPIITSLDWVETAGRSRSAFAMCHRYDSQLHRLPGAAQSAVLRDWGLVCSSHQLSYSYHEHP